MDVKSAFLYGKIKEEVYVCQPLGFEDPEFPDKVYKVEKALYGPHQAPRAWYETLSTYLLDNGFQREYVVAASCCGQVLWIQNQMLDYGYNFMTTKIFIDNEITICIVKNPVFHSKTKHIEIQHHFIRDSNEKKLIQMIRIHIDQNVVDLLTKAFDALLNADSSKLILLETSVRSDLHLEDAEGTECLPTAIIFEQLTLIGAKTTAWNEFSSTMASAIICLATNQKFNFSKYIFDHMVKNLEDVVKFLMFLRFMKVLLDSQVEGMLKHKEIYVTPSHTKKIFANMKRQGKDFSSEVTHLFETMMVQPQEDMGEDSEIQTDSHHTPTVTQPSTSSQPHQKQKSKKSKKRITEVPQLSDSTHDVADNHVTTTSNDPLLSGEDRLKLTELMELYTQLQSRVLALDTIKAKQALVIGSLKRRVKKLENKASEKTHKLKRLYKIGSSTRVKSFEDAGLGDQEDASKQGRMIDDLDADEGVTLIDETQGRNDQEMFDTSILDDEEIVAKKEVSTATTGKVVTNAGVEVNTAAITSQISMDEITLAKALIDIKTSKPKAKGIVMQEPSETPTPTPIDSSQQPSKAKYKGKAKMIGPKKPLKRKDQIMIDEEVARNLKAQLQAELEDKERLARQKEVEANIAKHFVALRAKEKRSKPPTKAQKRNIMSTYLKNMAGYKYNQLKTKSFEDILMLFDKEMKRVNTFVNMDTELVKGSEKAAEAVLKEQERCLEMIPDDEDVVTIEATPLSSKSPTIVDYKIYKEGRKSFFKIIRTYGDRLVKAMYLNEVFGYILLIKTKLLIKKLEDSEGGHQV
nr:putative ribonuclease H-like domain-containing protein [Tanacetum cinerariifolium]